MSVYFLVAVLLFTLVRARAIVTNECQHNVWIWSIPFVGSSHTENVPIKPGGQYLEPWRLGTSGTPGVAIKVSTQANGVDMLADEIDFAYSISSEDKSKIWVNLSSIRGTHLYSRVSFHTCVPGYTAATVEPHQCNATDEVELVLCGTTRTVPDTDSASLKQIQACYEPESDVSEFVGGQAEYYGSFEAFSTSFDTGGSKEQVQNPSHMPKAHCGTHWYDCSSCGDDEQPALEDESPVTDEPSGNNKPLHDDKLPVFGRCQARVVYTGRRNIRTSPTEGIRVTPTTHREQPTPLCEIVQRYHSDVKDCDEEAMKAHARAVYPHICESEYKSLLMGFSCEDVAKELRSTYPGVTNTTKARGEHDKDCECATHGGPECSCNSGMKTRDESQEMLQHSQDDRECLSNFCEPIIPGIKCAYLVSKLKVAAKSFGVNYKDLMNEDMEICLPTHRVTLDGRPIVCITKLCAQLDIGKECESMQTLLKHTAKAKINKDIEFSTDEAVCGN